MTVAASTVSEKPLVIRDLLRGCRTFRINRVFGAGTRISGIANTPSPMEWAKRMVRERQRSAEELLPKAVMEPGASHLAASLRYQQRNVEEGKCAVCPSPLAPHSVRFCVRHVEIARLRYTPKGAKGEAPPGSVDWLYGDGAFESRKGPTDLAKSRAKRAKKAQQNRR